jgi:pyridoxine 5'-phosphate synthase PdxJ
MNQREQVAADSSVHTRSTRRHIPEDDILQVRETFNIKNSEEYHYFSPVSEMELSYWKSSEKLVSRIIE